MQYKKRCQIFSACIIGNVVPVRFLGCTIYVIRIYASLRRLSTNRMALVYLGVSALLDFYCTFLQVLYVYALWYFIVNYTETVAPSTSAKV